MSYDWSFAKCTLGLYSSRKSYSSISWKNPPKTSFLRGQEEEGKIEEQDFSFLK
jgi:hypothetical protein